MRSDSTNSDARTPDQNSTPQMRDAGWLDAADLAWRLKCSKRHVIRLADGGAMPWGQKFGTLRRWSLREIEAWEAAGCPPVRADRGGRR